MIVYFLSPHKGSNLITINLQKTSVSDNDAKLFAEVLETNYTLSIILLQSNSIGNEGALALAEALKVNSTVTEINLRGNPVDNETKLLASKISNDRIKWTFW
ncbi:hypothetical protein GEMRC1_009017 [Eukaryota sp. GEM-RC1]